LSNNWISLVGVVIVTTSVVFWLFLLPMSLRGEPSHPYIGILAFLILPATFFLGLGLIPAGIFLHVRRARRKGVGYPENFPPLDFHSHELRRLLAFIGVTTVANLIIASQLTYRAVTYMDSSTFCGQTCHTVMQPEHTAYQNSPHSRVHCVACHIGPGASWFVRSKLSGAGQVFAVAFNTYPRPIPTPVTNLRPARETCEGCHWPERFEEDRLRVIPHYAEDEKNTFTQSVLMFRLGGGRVRTGVHGAHLARGVEISYAPADPSRQSIPRVEYRNSVTGRTTVYLAPEADASALAKMPTRVMDCIDCHNRPTHTFELPGPALDKAMAAGFVSPSLPFVKKQGLELLQKTYTSREEAAAAIPAALDGYYKQNHSALYGEKRAEIARSAQGILSVYNRNVFPDMKVTWGTYPNNLGHTDFPGCFRCHDAAHESKDGRSIGQDCSACHQILAMDEAAPKILSDLGIVPTPETSGAEEPAPPPSGAGH
jgi:hypothetical protein